MALLAVMTGGALLIPRTPASQAENAPQKHHEPNASEPGAAEVTRLGHTRPIVEALETFVGRDREDDAPDAGLGHLEHMQRVARRLEAENFSVDFVIASLPDYVDSHVKRLFDPAVAGIQQAAARLGYTLERFVLPGASSVEQQKHEDEHEAEDKRRTEAEQRDHEAEPGAILFRLVENQQITRPAHQHGASNRAYPRALIETPGALEPPASKTLVWPDQRQRLLVVLVIAETPTSGLHQEAFLSAAELVARWRETYPDMQESADAAGAAGVLLRVLGPTFSGTALSLRAALQRFRAAMLGMQGSKLATAPLDAWVVTGSATADETGDVIESASSDQFVVRFGRTVSSSADILHALGVYLGGLRPEWARGKGVALLVESNTTFGNSAAKTAAASDDASTRPLQVDTIVRFPLHVSRLRRLAVATAAVGQSAANRPRFSLEDSTTTPSDLLPSTTPELTSAVVEHAVQNVLAALRREGATAVGILATDARDHLFLAREISQQIPNALMFGTDADLLYLHDDYAPFLRGTVIASTYPLFNETQLEAANGRRDGRSQFALNIEQGISNAVVGLVSGVRACDDAPALWCMADARYLTDYATPGGWEQATPGGVLRAPPVWLSVVGRDALWPVASVPSVRDDHMLRVLDPATREHARVAAFASPWAIGVAAVVIAAALVHAAGLVSATRERRRRARGQGASTFGAWLRDAHAAPSQAVEEDARTAPEGSGAGLTFGERRADRAFDGALLMLFLALGAASLWVSDWAWIWLREPALDGESWGIRAGATVLMATALAGPVACAVALAMVTARSVRRLLSAGALRRGRRHLSHWTRAIRYGIALGVIACVALLVLLAVAVPTMRHPSDGLAFTRMATLTNGISPTPPVLLLTAVLYLAAFWNMRRLKMHSYRLAHGWWIFELLGGGSAEVRRQVRRSALEYAPWHDMGSPMALRIPVVCGVAVLVAGWPVGTTLESAAFTRWFWWASVLALIAMGRVTGRAVAQGRVLKDSLDRLAAHPILPAYARLAGKPLEWKLSLSPLRRQAIVPLIEEVRLLVATPGMPDDIVARGNALICCASPWTAARVPLIASCQWPRLLELVSVLTRALQRQAWDAHERMRQRPAPDTAALSAIGRAEVIVAFALTFVIRSLLARVVSSLSIALGGFGLVLLAHLTYAFQGRAFWVRLDLICLSAAAVVSAVTLIRFEKDRLLSVLWATDPGRINWTGGFLYRIAVTVGVPTVLLIASLFPELAGSLAGVLEPLQKALP